MPINKALIFSAGLGTRMGDIGTVLPKPLWKIFNKSILQTQIDFIRTLGITEIFVNVHHRSELIKKEISGVTFLDEPVLLNNGGTLNALKKITSDLILTLNADHLSFFDFQIITESLKFLDTYDHLLFAITASGSENRLIVEDDCLKTIESFSSNSPLTYSGIGIINLSKINHCETGPFFSAVDYKTSKIFIKHLNTPFFNLGTTKDYYITMFNLLSNPPAFLIHNQNLDPAKISGNSYNCTANHSINLTDTNLQTDNVILMEKTSLKIKENSIYYYDHVSNW